MSGGGGIVDVMSLRRGLMMRMASGNIEILYHYVFTEQLYGKRVDLPNNAFTKYKKIWVIVYAETGSNSSWIYPFQFNTDNTSGDLWYNIDTTKLPLPYCVMLNKDTVGNWNVTMTASSIKTATIIPSESGNYFVTRMYNSASNYFATGSEIIVIGEKDN